MLLPRAATGGGFVIPQAPLAEEHAHDVALFSGGLDSLGWAAQHATLPHPAPCSSSPLRNGSSRHCRSMCTKLCKACGGGEADYGVFTRARPGARHVAGASAGVVHPLPRPYCPRRPPCTRPQRSTPPSSTCQKTDNSPPTYHCRPPVPEPVRPARCIHGSFATSTACSPRSRIRGPRYASRIPSRPSPKVKSAKWRITPGCRSRCWRPP